jgi:hypothetical protein
MKHRTPLTAMALAVVAGLLTLGSGLSSADTTVVVNSREMNGWAFLLTSATGVGEFVNGPETPPLGNGSLRLSAGTHGHLSAQLRNRLFHGVRLLDLTALTYTAFATKWDGQALPYIVLNVDLNGDGVFALADDDLLIFEPAYQTPVTGNPSLPDQGPVRLTSWQQWNALAGGWWSLHGIAEATPGNGVKPLQQYLAAQPQATIVNATNGAGGIRLVVGFGEEQDELDGHVDALTIGLHGADITFNFAADPTTIAVEIDIAPRTNPNAVDSHSSGFVSVAIVSTPDFSAPQDIDHTSLTFGRKGDEWSLVGCHPQAEDVNDDGLLDLVCAFQIARTGFRCDDVEGILQGTLFDGRSIQGMDSVMTEPCS